MLGVQNSPSVSDTPVTSGTLQATGHRSDITENGNAEPFIARDIQERCSGIDISQASVVPVRGRFTFSGTESGHLGLLLFPDRPSSEAHELKSVTQTS